MEIIFYNGFEMEAYYLHYVPDDGGYKVFICQKNIVFTDMENVVQESADLTPFIVGNIDVIIQSIEDSLEF